MSTNPYSFAHPVSCYSCDHTILYHPIPSYPIRYYIRMQESVESAKGQTGAGTRGLALERMAIPAVLPAPKNLFAKVLSCEIAFQPYFDHTLTIL